MDCTLSFFGKHFHHHADKEQRDENRRNVKGAERGELRRDRRTDIRAHDDRRRLVQGHNARVYETDDHDRSDA